MSIKFFFVCRLTCSCVVVKAALVWLCLCHWCQPVILVCRQEVLIGAVWFGALPFDAMIVSTPRGATCCSATPADVESPRSVTNESLFLFLLVRFEVVGRGLVHLSVVQVGV